MILALVGPEADKWTTAGEESARNVIRAYLATGKYAGVTSGACHLGGVDIWAREECNKARIPIKEYPAREHRWDGRFGYRARNIAIVRLADEIVCITPERHQDARSGWCKHCREKNHVSSGGCWTVQYAAKIGKQHDVVIINVL